MFEGMGLVSPQGRVGHGAGERLQLKLGTQGVVAAGSCSGILKLWLPWPFLLVGQGASWAGHSRAMMHVHNATPVC